MDELSAKGYEQLQKLKAELTKFSYHDIVKLQQWMDYATPIIERWLPSSLMKFQEICKSPRPRLSLQQLSQCRDNSALKERYILDLQEKNTRNTYGRISRYLDGVLVAHAPDDSSESQVPDSGESNAVFTQDTIDPRKVFVVYGRNKAANRAMFDFLRAINLHPLEWGEILAATGSGSPYTGDVLAKGFSMAKAVVVLLTPDDEARLLPQFHGHAEKEYEKELITQPRPNVIFEAGMALGLHPNRTIIVELGELRPMSDTLGRHVIRMSNLAAGRQELTDRLRTAGCDVDTHGKTAWLDAGDFENCVQTIKVSQNATDDKFLLYIDGLSEDELYRLAIAVKSKSSSVSKYYSDPCADLLIAKGFLQRVDDRERPRSEAIPCLIPPTVWQYLNENRQWLITATKERNPHRPERLKEL
jgi:predicted nucleotide-binding protein